MGLRPNILLIACLAVAACKAGGDRSASIRAGGANAGTTTVDEVGCGGGGLFLATPPEPAPGKSTIVFNLNQDDVDPCSVQGYVVGQSDELKMESAGNGVYFIPDVPEGSSDVVILASQKPETTAATEVTKPTDVAGGNLAQVATAKVGLRLNDVIAVAGKTTTLADTTRLVRVGRITGQAFLEDQDAHDGILATIPGTKWVSFTDAQGRYALEDVVVGLHDLAFSKDQFHDARIGTAEVFEGRTTELPDVLLRLNRGETGPLLIAGAPPPNADGSVTLSDVSVSFSILTTGRPVKMKVSHENGCPNTPYESFVSSGFLRFPLSETLLETGYEEVTLYLCLIDRDNTPSLLQQSIAIDVFGNRGVVPFTAPRTLDRSYPSIPLTVEADVVTRDGVELVLTAEVAGAPRSDAETVVPLAGYVTFTPADGSTCASHRLHLRPRAQLESGATVHGSVTSADVAFVCLHPIASRGRPDYAQQELIYPSAIAVDGKLALVGSEFPNSVQKRLQDLYDPRTRTWERMNETDGPGTIGRNPWVFDAGTRLVVMGGDDGFPSRDYYERGGIYDLDARTWTEIPRMPFQRGPGRFFWTGEHLLFYYYPPDGEFASQGMSLYHPASATWSDVSRTGAPSYRQGEVAVWTGRRLIVWNGRSFDPDTGYGPSLNDGALYDPWTDSWSAMAESPVIYPVDATTSHWNGRELIVLSTGDEPRTFAYDPDANSWRTLPKAPEKRTASKVVTSTAGSVLWMGKDGNDVPLGDGLAFTDRWRRIFPDDCFPVAGKPLTTLIENRLVVWPPRCGKHLYELDTNRWSGHPEVTWPELAGDAASAPILMGALGSRFYLYEVATDATTAGVAPAFFGAAGRSPLGFRRFSTGTGDTGAAPGETFGLGFTIDNLEVPSRGGTLEVVSAEAPLRVVTSEVALPALPANEATRIPARRGPQLRVEDSAAAPGKANVTLRYRTEEGISGTFVANVFVRRPFVVARLSDALSEAGGNGTLVLTIVNQGTTALESAEIDVGAATCVTSAGSASIASLAAGAARDITVPLTLSGSCANGADARVAPTVTYRDEAGRSYVQTLPQVTFRLGRFRNELISDATRTIPDDGTPVDYVLAVSAVGVVDRIYAEFSGVHDDPPYIETHVVPPGSAPVAVDGSVFGDGNDYAIFVEDPDLEDFGSLSSAGNWTLRISYDYVGYFGDVRAAKLIVEGLRN